MIGPLRPLEWGWLGVAGLLGLLMAMILSSIGDAPRWLPDAPVHAPPSFQMQAAPTPALRDLAGTWQAPLFSPAARSPSLVVISGT